MGDRRQHAFNVVSSKAEARKDLTEMLWPILGATLLFFVPYYLLSMALQLACYGQGTELLPEISRQQLIICLLLFEAGNLLFLQPLYFGLTQFYALRRAGGRPPISMVVICLTSARLYFKSIRMALIVLLFAFLWAIPVGLLCGAGYAFYAMILPTQVGSFLFIEVCILAAAIYLSILLRYHCSYAMVMEQPKLSCWKAVRKTSQQFRGHGRELFSLVVSFSFWIVIAILLNGFPLVIVLPYMLLAVYHLFDRIRGVQIRVTEKRMK